MAVVSSDVDLAAVVGPLGAMAVGVVSGRLAAIAFGHRNESAALGDVRVRIERLARTQSCDNRADAEAADVLEELLDYAAGVPVEFSDWPLVDRRQSAFQRRVVAACRRIPRGQTRTYGELAAQVGNRGAARAVGTVMAANPLPLVVPCHRVLAAGGKLGGYSARQGLRMKRRLLQLEREPRG